MEQARVQDDGPAARVELVPTAPNGSRIAMWKELRGLGRRSQSQSAGNLKPMSVEQK